MAVRKHVAALLVSAAAVCAACAAPVVRADEQIYRSVDEHGRAVFSDTPPAATEPAEPVDLPAVNEYDSERPVYLSEPGGAQSGQPAEPAPSYRSVRIAAPANDEAVRNNAGNVHIDVTIEPELAPGHSVQLLIDDEPAGTNQTGRFDLTNVDRGTHQIQARIIDDATGKVLAESEPSVFHLKRHFIRRKG